MVEFSDSIFSDLVKETIVADIPWKKYDLYMDIHGEEVHAEIMWWAKDYYILVKKPREIKLPGRHMLYMLPAKFVIDREERIGNVKHIPILETCKSMILSVLHG